MTSVLFIFVKKEIIVVHWKNADKHVLTDKRHQLVIKQDTKKLIIYNNATEGHSEFCEIPSMAVSVKPNHI